MKKVIKTESRIIYGKKVRINIIDSDTLSAHADYPNIITISRIFFPYLKKKGGELILLHERSHLNKLNFFISASPLVFLIFSVYIFRYKNTSLFIASLFLLFISIILSYWLREIFADRKAIMISKSRLYQKTYKKIYRHPSYTGNKSWVYKNFSHPPERVRFYFIRRFEKEYAN